MSVGEIGNPRRRELGRSFELANIPEAGEGIPLRMLWVESGTFMMGSPTTEVGRDDELEGFFRATLSRGFWLSQFPVTQAQYRKVIGCLSVGNPEPSMFVNLPDSAERPVETVSWHDASVFCQHLNHLHAAQLPSGYYFSLPSEMEWEYACRAGTTSRYYLGDSDAGLDSAAWHGLNSGGTTHPVGQKEPNGWMFFDMLGNVDEWCLDCMGLYPSGAATDWVCTGGTESRMSRGGHWRLPERHGLRCASRLDADPRSRYPFQGFRLAARFDQRCALYPFGASGTGA